MKIYFYGKGKRLESNIPSKDYTFKRSKRLVYIGFLSTLVFSRYHHHQILNFKVLRKNQSKPAFCPSYQAQYFSGILDSECFLSQKIKKIWIRKLCHLTNLDFKNI
jgi:hypothetical protein